MREQRVVGIDAHAQAGEAGQRGTHVGGKHLLAALAAVGRGEFARFAQLEPAVRAVDSDLAFDAHVRRVQRFQHHADREAEALARLQRRRRTLDEAYAHLRPVGDDALFPVSECAAGGGAVGGEATGMPRGRAVEVLGVLEHLALGVEAR